MALSRSCPHCGFINAVSAAFCGNCGQNMTSATRPASPTSPPVYCPYCEQENPAGATFCGHCGRSLTNPAVDMPPMPVAAPPAPLADEGQRRRYLPALVAVFGLILLAAAALFLLLQSDIELPPSLAGLRGEDRTEEDRPPVGDEATDEPTAEPLSRVAGDRADYTVFRSEDGAYALWLVPQNGHPAFLATSDGHEYTAEAINAGPLDAEGAPQAIPGWTRLTTPEFDALIDEISGFTFGDATSGFRLSGQPGIAENVQMPNQAPPIGGEGEATSVAEISPTAAGQAPTVTPFPTSTPRPTLTPLPTRTSLPPTPLPSPTPILQPSPTPIPPPPTSPPVICQVSPGDRWGPTLWDRYKDTLGCATTGEIRSNAAYQYYQHGMMVWRETPDLVYVLYNNGTFNTFPAAGPDGYFDSDWLKGSFGYLWNNNATVRAQIGQPQAAEFNATDFAAQDFAGGTIFYFFENDARNYALFSSSGTWTSAQE